MKLLIAIICAVMLVFPSQALAQTSQAVVLLDNYGTHSNGERIFVFGKITNILSDKFLIMQIVNPNNDLCQIQQLTPLSNGLFVTEPIPLSGRLCGVAGEYTIKINYGDYSSTSIFEVLSKKYSENTVEGYLDLAFNVISEKIQIAKEKNIDVSQIESKLDSVKLQASEESLSYLKDLFVDLEMISFDESDLFDLDTSIKESINSIIEYSTNLLTDNKITADVDNNIKREIYATIFYSKISNTKNAIESINEATILLANSDPIKVPTKRDLSYSELEDLVLNLMTKNNSLMSRSLQEELAFIFARGTSPLYVDELGGIVDLLTKGRFLDSVSRNEDSLYQLVNTTWSNLRSSVAGAETITEFLEKKDKVTELYNAAVLLKSLDKVERFITSDSEANSKLANILQPRWNSLKSELSLSTSADDIIKSGKEITDMKNAIEISSRISKIMEISQATNVDSDVRKIWENLLAKVEQAQSMDEILQIVLEFDKTISSLQEKRNPLSTLEFEYKQLKSMAELQADYKNLFDINNALKAITSAQNLEKENYSGPRYDRIEVLLAWANSRLPEIKSELSSYSKESYDLRASDILQRAKAIENLVDMGITTNRFLPGYNDFATSVKNQINDARELVMKKDLDAADRAVAQLFRDWQKVSKAYAEDPEGSDIGYSVDELRKIEYGEEIDSLSNIALEFQNPSFEPYMDEYFEMEKDTIKSVEYGNFADADLKIDQLRTFLINNLPLQNEHIIFDTSYDVEKNIWTMKGAVDSQSPVREYLDLTVFNDDGTIHSSMRFSDAKSGDFFTQWQTPTEPGIYVVLLQYNNSQATKIINIQEKSKTTYPNSHNTIAKEFEELEEFIDKFGDQSVPQYKTEFVPLLEKIRTALSKNDQSSVKNDVSNLKNLIEKYLQIKSRSAIIEATIDGDKLLVAGAVQKTISFREELYLTIYDQRGNMVDDEIFYDDASGHYNVLLSKPSNPGLYVAQLEYHEIKVTDIFQVK